MAETSYPATAHNGRALSEVELERWTSHWGDGVLGDPTDTTVAYADSSGRQLKVRANKRMLVRNQVWDSGSDEIVVPTATNTSGSTRVDRLVARLDRATFTVRLAIIQGTPGAGVPALTQQTGSSGYWDVPILRATLASGYTTIAAADVTYEAWCLGRPPMIGPGLTLPTSGLRIGQDYRAVDAASGARADAWWTGAVMRPGAEFPIYRGRRRIGNLFSNQPGLRTAWTSPALTVPASWALRIRMELQLKCGAQATPDFECLIRRVSDSQTIWDGCRRQQRNTDRGVVYSADMIYDTGAAETSLQMEIRTDITGGTGYDACATVDRPFRFEVWSVGPSDWVSTA